MSVFFALANGLGRIGWGMVPDKLGRKTSLFRMLACQGVVMLLFYRMEFSVQMLYLGAALIGFNFGGNFALFPAATADFFGNRNVGQIMAGSSPPMELPALSARCWAGCS